MDCTVRFVDFPLHYQRLKSEIDAAIKDVLLGGDYIMRRHLRDFENNLASLIGVNHAVGVNSGTDALHLSLLAAGVGPGDEVITVAHTFVATVASIVHCGAKPVLVDVGKDFNMNISQIESAISPQTKAIIPVYLNGRLCDMDGLMTIARKYNLLVIEDAAQAIGAEFDGQKAGSFGLAGCFSFYPAKLLGGLGDGGAVVTNSREISENIRLLRDHGQQRATGKILHFGFNSRLDNLHAAVLDIKLRHLPDWIERRQELARLYEKGLSGLSQIQTPPPPSPGRYFDVYTNYVMRTQERDRLMAHLTERGVEILVSWPIPLHHQPALGLSRFHLPQTEAISREVISLPMYPELSNEQADYVVEAVKDFFK